MKTNDLFHGSLRDSPFVVAKCWIVRDFLGSGSFGATYKGVKMSGLNRTSRTGTKLPEEVAIKFERISTNCPQLEIEYKIMNMLNDSSSGGSAVKGIPKAYSLTVEGEYKCLVMTLLGPSIYSLFEKRNVHRWSYCTVAAVGLQMLSRIEHIHSKGYIHRDIKPDNFLVGREGDRNIYAIDFGLAKTFRTSGNAHIPIRQGKQLTGTARYASINAHKGYEQSRRDDLEGMVYCLIYLTSGKLPWQGLRPPQNASQKYRHIQLIKEKTSTVDVCKPTNSPELLHLLSEARSYSYNQRPRYALMRNILIHGIIARQYMYSHISSPPPGVVKIPHMDWTQGESVTMELLNQEAAFFSKLMTDDLEYDRTFYASRHPSLNGYPSETRDIKGYQHLLSALYPRTNMRSEGRLLTSSAMQMSSMPNIPQPVHVVKGAAGYLTADRQKRVPEDRHYKWGANHELNAEYNIGDAARRRNAGIGYERKIITSRTQAYDDHQSRPPVKSMVKYDE